MPDARSRSQHFGRTPVARKRPITLPSCVTPIFSNRKISCIVITSQEIFLFEKMGVTQDGKVIGRFRATGVRPKCCERLRASGIHLPTDMFEGVTEVR